MKKDTKWEDEESALKLSVPLANPKSENLDAIQSALQKAYGITSMKLEKRDSFIDIIYDINQVDFLDIYQSLLKLGLCIPTSKILIEVTKMNCISCIAHLEGELLDIPGVINVQASISSETVEVTYVNGLVSGNEIQDAIGRLGYL